MSTGLPPRTREQALDLAYRGAHGGVVSYGGAKRFRRTAAGIEETDLAGETLHSALVDELEMSDEIVDHLRTALTEPG